MRVPFAFLVLGILVGIALAVLFLPRKTQREVLPHTSSKNQASADWSAADMTTVNRLISAGDAETPWRHALNALRSSDSGANQFGASTIVSLASKDVKLKPVAIALLEDQIIHSARLDWTEEMILLGYYDLLERVRPAASKVPPDAKASDSDRSHKAIDMADADLKKGRLSSAAVDLCDEILASPSVDVRRDAIPILVVAGRMPGISRAWALQVCKTQSAKEGSDKMGVWFVLGEAITGELDAGTAPEATSQNSSSQLPKPRPNLGGGL